MPPVDRLRMVWSLVEAGLARQGNHGPSPRLQRLVGGVRRYGVKFALLGGYAVGDHSKPRATKDLDLLISGLDRNLERVASALQAFGVPAT